MKHCLKTGVQTTVDVFSILTLLLPEISDSSVVWLDFQVKEAKIIYIFPPFGPAGAVQLHQESEAAMDTVSPPALTLTVSVCLEMQNPPQLGFKKKTKTCFFSKI